MALIKDIHKSGVTIPSCYIKVSKFYGDKNVLFFTVDYKADKDALPFAEENRSIALQPDGDNFIAQAYEHLKTLPEFEGAVDG